MRILLKSALQSKLLVSGVLPDKIIVVGGSGDKDFAEECIAK